MLILIILNFIFFFLGNVWDMIVICFNYYIIIKNINIYFNCFKIDVIIFSYEKKGEW